MTKRKRRRKRETEEDKEKEEKKKNQMKQKYMIIVFVWNNNNKNETILYKRNKTSVEIVIRITQKPKAECPVIAPNFARTVLIQTFLQSSGFKNDNKYL